MAPTRAATTVPSAPPPPPPPPRRPRRPPRHPRRAHRRAAPRLAARATSRSQVARLGVCVPGEKLPVDVVRPRRAPVCKGFRTERPPATTRWSGWRRRRPVCRGARERPEGVASVAGGGGGEARRVSTLRRVWRLQPVRPPRGDGDPGEPPGRPDRVHDTARRPLRRRPRPRPRPGRGLRRHRRLIPPEAARHAPGVDEGTRRPPFPAPLVPSPLLPTSPSPRPAPPVQVLGFDGAVAIVPLELNGICVSAPLIGGHRRPKTSSAAEHRRARRSPLASKSPSVAPSGGVDHLEQAQITSSAPSRPRRPTPPSKPTSPHSTPSIATTRSSDCPLKC